MVSPPGPRSNNRLIEGSFIFVLLRTCIGMGAHAHVAKIQNLATHPTPILMIRN